MNLSLQQSLALAESRPAATVCNWPNGKPFALFLSHDVDQIHDRELFRVLADANHIRRRLMRGEPGNVYLAGRRIIRSLLSPKPAQQDFETLLAIEGRYGFRSTFFLLHDKYWARQGARYSFKNRDLHQIVNMIQEMDCELGVHGGYYRFNEAALYRQSMEAVEKEFGMRPNGIRNHLLRFSYPETWRAQAEAGFAYDATYGIPQELGPRGGWPFPFKACDVSQGALLDLIELPITVMDVTLFRYLRLEGETALQRAWETVQQVIKAGGLVSLLWHNNYFNEPEYADWQWVYEELLKRLSKLKPWCATGSEINAWWRAKSSVLVNEVRSHFSHVELTLHSKQTVCDLALDVNMSGQIRLRGAKGTFEKIQGGTRIHFSRLRTEQGVHILASN